jgi:SAM-dependent methyltransferase
MLHLQCHFGLDTMSWARLGAIPTGMDFSDRAIAHARALNDELGLNCKFVQSDIYELPKNLTGQFNIVYTSYGVLTWLPDMAGWAKVIDHFLKPGGTFYIAEIHPFSCMLDDGVKTQELRLRYPYFHVEEPHSFKTEGSYAVPDAEFKEPLVYEWTHSMGDILNAILDVGLKIEYLHEFDYTVFRQVPFMEEREGCLFYLPEGVPDTPLLFSLKATKPE